MRTLALSWLVLLASCAGVPRAGKRAPEVEGPNVDGKTARLSDYRGRVVLVDFWATWCPPCKDTMPMYQKLYAARAKDGFVVIAISEDETATDISSFGASRGLTYPIWRDANRAAYNAFGVYEMPAAFLIGRDGRIVRRWDGFIPVDSAETGRAVDALLAKP